jgi:hypothetical protein
MHMMRDMALAEGVRGRAVWVWSWWYMLAQRPWYEALLPVDVICVIVEDAWRLSEVQQMWGARGELVYPVARQEIGFTTRWTVRTFHDRKITSILRAEISVPLANIRKTNDQMVMRLAQGYHSSRPILGTLPNCSTFPTSSKTCRNVCEKL